jgi:hypothetical protein
MTTTTTTTGFDDTNALCFACQAEAFKTATGAWFNNQHRNVWAFGCTCSTEDAEAATAFFASQH